MGRWTLVAWAQWPVRTLLRFGRSLASDKRSKRAAARPRAGGRMSKPKGDIQCANCGRKVAKSRHGRRYCSPQCRFEAWRKVRGMEHACTYCGVPGDSVDHVPATSVRPYLREHAPGVYPELQVPCCRECNSLLGARGFKLSDRRELVRRALERKYAYVLRMPNWTAEDRAEMGPSLTADIEQHQRLQGWVRARLANAS